MKLIPELNAQILALADQADAQGALADWHRANRARLLHHLLPEKFAETWKYTKLHALADGHLAHRTPVADVPADLPHFSQADIEPLVIVNGRLPDALPHWPGVTLKRLSPSDTTVAPLAETTFGLLNGASAEQGLHLQVASHQHPEACFHVILISNGNAPSHHNTRLLVELAADSSLKLVEHYMGDGPVLCNAVTEIIAHEASRLEHCRLQSESADNLHIGQLAMRLERNSHVRSFQFMQGARLKRNDVLARLEGEGAELTMGGAFVARGKDHVDNQICVEHCVPHGTSNHDYKGIAGDQGRIIFNGRIHILPGASQTSANLSNKNLLLSQGAEIDSKPELEIYNDDVKCSHGTTIGKLDPDMRFYMQSRGIDATAAQRMLSMGFIQQQIDALSDEPLANWIRQWLEQAVTEVSA